ncbi:phosphodiesterase [Methylobacterium nodulans]|uniref:Metallophosphoesterase n=1 Tax=Methylobacterium nodulans (strain LMG 21967 / CNCM I-2342 / ORS 2060) TaxID=460265 RepID=B8IG31_METNO|nr:phosphodiesterase [Methylobacterium nodulans]ACL61508.1 metallophosphoesterase [Methylobacterium nodulans ORS 2060]
MLIAQITDLHVRPRGRPAYRVAETNMLVERAIDALIALQPRPDVVLVTGDLTDCGLPEEYALLRSLLGRLPIPIFVVPGNHDRREALRAGLPAAWLPDATQDFVQYVVDDWPMRLIGLDTLVPGSSHGELCERRLAFLEDALAAGRDRPTLLFMHHPPFACGMEDMDRIRLIDGEARFRALVGAHANIERIVCGHHHRPIQARYAGTLALVAPSVAHQVALDLMPSRDSGLVLEPPAFQLHRYTPETGLVSHMAYVERYPGPFPFVLDPDYPGQA